MEPIIINIFNIINSPYCISDEDGQKIYILLHRAISEKRKVILSFKGIELVITAFLNAAIGQLFKDFSESEVGEFLDKCDFNEVFQPAWDKVMQGAPIYYANPEKTEQQLYSYIND